MDQDSQENLRRILTLTEGELTPEDIAFLRARRSYLTKSQLNDYAHLLTAPQQTQEVKPQKAKKVVTAPEVPQDNDIRPGNVPPEVAGVAPVAPEQTQEQEEEDAPANPEAGQVVEGADQTQEECLDPDCTHENHPAPEVPNDD